MDKQGYDQATIVLSLIRDEQKKPKVFHCCLMPKVSAT